MADTLSTQIFGSVSWSWVETYTDLGTITDRSKLEYNKTLLDGTGASQGDIIWRETRSLNASASYTYDLTALPVSMFGESSLTYALAKIKGMAIFNDGTAAGQALTLTNVSVSNQHVAMFNGATAASIEIPAGGFWGVCNKLGTWACGAGVLGLKVTNQSGSVATSYRIVIYGTTA